MVSEVERSPSCFSLCEMRWNDDGESRRFTAAGDSQIEYGCDSGHMERSFSGSRSGSCDLSI